MDTDILVGLSTGPRRRSVLDGWFSERRTASIVRRDRAGLTTKWTLPYRGVRRGDAVALNPAFPLMREVRAVLTSLAKQYDVRTANDMTPAEIGLLTARHDCDTSIILGSRIRTKIFAVLEIFGGRIEVGRLQRIVPDEVQSSVAGEVINCVKNGILIKVGGQVRFPDAPWRPPLRKLLRAFVAFHPDFKPRVMECEVARRRSLDDAKDWALFGKHRAERVLMALAKYGPMTPLKLQTVAKRTGGFDVVGRLAKTGIVSDTGKGRARRVGLNPAYPVYRELRRCLLSLQGLEPSRVRTQPGRATPGPYAPEIVFGTKPRLWVLLMLHLAGEEGIAMVDLKRSRPQHDYNAMWNKVLKFEEAGIVKARVEGQYIKYLLDPAFPHYKPLDDLLAAIVRGFPELKAKELFRGRERLWPHGRVVAERNRRLRLTSGR